MEGAVVFKVLFLHCCRPWRMFKLWRNHFRSSIGAMKNWNRLWRGSERYVTVTWLKLLIILLYNSFDAACWFHNHRVRSLFQCGTQWCTFSSVFSHRLIKIPKDRLFQPPRGPWSDWNNSSGGLVSHCFYDTVDKPAIVFSTKFKPQVSAKDRGVDKCVQTSGAPCSGWSKQPRLVHGQS